MLGHEGGKSQGTGALIYFRRVGAANFQRVVRTIRYPDAVEAAYRALIALAHGQ